MAWCQVPCAPWLSWWGLGWGSLVCRQWIVGKAPSLFRRTEELRDCTNDRDQCRLQSVPWADAPSAAVCPCDVQWWPEDALLGSPISEPSACQALPSLSTRHVVVGSEGE